MLSSTYAVWLKSLKTLTETFQPDNVRWLYTIFYFENLYENYCHEQSVKINTCVKYSIDAYHAYHAGIHFAVFFWGLKIPWLSWWFPQSYAFPVTSLLFPPFQLVFPHVSPGVLLFPSVFLLFPRSVSPVSYFRFCKIMNALVVIGNKIFYRFQ